MCGDCFVCIYLVCQCDGLELGRRNRRITVRGIAVRINTEEDGEPVWACDPQPVDLIGRNFDHQGLYTKRAINTWSSLADVHKDPPMAISSSTQGCKHQIMSEIPEVDEYRPYFSWVIVDTIKRLLSTLHNGESQLPPSP